jgi:opacity protein-like surface antigen
MQQLKIHILVLLCITFLPLAVRAQESQPDSAYIFMPIKNIAPDTLNKTNSLGVNVMLGNNGFGIGFFYKQQINSTLSWMLSLSGSEAKAPNEVETYYYDFYGNIYKTVLGKVNQLFVVPAMIGLQYRLFKDEITETFQPYVNAGIGPNVVLAFPYNTPFSKSFSGAHSYFGVGAYVGAGTYFGLTSNSLMGISIRYYILPMSKHYAIQSIQNEPMANFNTFFLSFDLATQY